jgi:hypothetical protein
MAFRKFARRVIIRHRTSIVLIIPLSSASTFGDISLFRDFGTFFKIYGGKSHFLNRILFLIFFGVEKFRGIYRDLFYFLG